MEVFSPTAILLYFIPYLTVIMTEDYFCVVDLKGDGGSVKNTHTVGKEYSSDMTNIILFLYF